MVSVRWMDIEGKKEEVMLVEIYMKFKFQVGICLEIIECQEWIKIYMELRLKEKNRIKKKEERIVMEFEVMKMEGMIYIKGGMKNNLIVMMIVKVIIQEKYI